MTFKKYVLTICFFSLSLTCSAASQVGKSAVAMPDSYSADVAQAILQSGGNAVDAAIAAQFVLAVTLPEAGNIGGGGFMLVLKDGVSTFLDYRETAPAKAHRDMYLDEQGNVIPSMSVYGVQSVGVPGAVDGMWKAHKKYATKTWKELVQPSIELAEQGFIVHQKLAENIEERLDRFSQDEFTDLNIWVNFSEYFSAAKAGVVFKQPELAATLKRIAEHGRDGFYKGETAELIVDLMDKHGGLISMSDLGGYQAKWRNPIEVEWRDMTLLSAPPPSSGGIAVFQWLSMYDLVKARVDEQFEHNSTRYVHVLSEAGKRVFADRAEYLGDPDFVDVPVETLLSADYIRGRAKAIDVNAISDTEKVRPGIEESMDTTHFSIVDKWGNAVSNTTTLNLSFGSGVVVPDAGFLLNDEMDDFSAKAGVANTYGALGGAANEIQPHKRMLSSMTPSILLKNDQVKLVTGSPGGTTIITSVYQSILNVIDFNMSAEDAVNTPRFHHQLHPKDTIWHHPGMAEQTLKALSDMGYQLGEYPYGDLHLIIRRGDAYDAASQASGRGKSVVF